MTSVGVLPSDQCIIETGMFLIFIVPAAAGCNLYCSFCIIEQRQKIPGRTVLQPEDFARFIRAAVEQQKIPAIAIQRYEPLLPSSLPYTHAILSAARLHAIPASLVTNG